VCGGAVGQARECVGGELCAAEGDAGHLEAQLAEPARRGGGVSAVVDDEQDERERVFEVDVLELERGDPGELGVAGRDRAAWWCGARRASGAAVGCDHAGDAVAGAEVAAGLRAEHA
jgi:hypothetical protein